MGWELQWTCTQQTPNLSPRRHRRSHLACVVWMDSCRKSQMNKCKTGVSTCPDQRERSHARATESTQYHLVRWRHSFLSHDHPRAMWYATRLSSIPDFNIPFVVLRHIIPFVPPPPIEFRLCAPSSIPEWPVLILGLLLV
jgi:hypothetical protein